jgi:predicted nucleic acid-binding protein
MKYVLDASVAVKCVLPEKDSPRAVRLINAYRKPARPPVMRSNDCRAGIQ